LRIRSQVLVTLRETKDRFIPELACSHIVNQPRVEKAYEKHAWILPFALGVLFLPTAVQNLLGIDPDPTTAERIIGMTFSELRASNPGLFDLALYYVRFSGLADLGFAFLITAISVTAYRRGEKWAWYALWSLPAFFIVSATIVLSTLGSTALELVLLILFMISSLLGLLFPYRKFFPRK